MDRNHPLLCGFLLVTFFSPFRLQSRCPLPSFFFGFVLSLQFMLLSFSSSRLVDGLLSVDVIRNVSWQKAAQSFGARALNGLAVSWRKQFNHCCRKFKGKVLQSPWSKEKRAAGDRNFNRCYQTFYQHKQKRKWRASFNRWGDRRWPIGHPVGCEFAQIYRHAPFCPFWTHHISHSVALATVSRNMAVTSNASSPVWLSLSLSSFYAANTRITYGSNNNHFKNTPRKAVAGVFLCFCQFGGWNFSFTATLATKTFRLLPPWQVLLKTKFPPSSCHSVGRAGSQAKMASIES